MKDINIWWALGFMAAGYALAMLQNRQGWNKYYEGKDEAKEAENDEHARHKIVNTRRSAFAGRTAAGRAAPK